MFFGVKCVTEFFYFDTPGG